ncbi:tryptophan halogenase [Alteromonas sp. I4]|nr:tryptophan halogenase [Alteromonas sp. I4]
MNRNDIKRVVIVGGGTAGWMTAAALANKLQGLAIDIELIESDSIGTVGVGEATLPHIRFFNSALGIDEAAFMRETEATIKLGIEFCDWGNLGESYIHPFGDFGLPINNVDFYQHWLKHFQSGAISTPLHEYAAGVMSARHNKFRIPEQSSSNIEQHYGYAYQFDSSLYAKFLQRYAQAKGVIRTEGKIVEVKQHNDSGEVVSLVLDNQAVIEGDFFVDCSGFRGLLIEQTLHAGYDDWSEWLPCNRAVAIPCESTDPLMPYTRATAKAAGWQWRIPLQHRTGNGFVYWSEHISDDEASSQLLSALDGKPLAEPNQLYFKAGRRNVCWEKNVVAIGLSSGFLEPLESTSIHLIQEGITTLIELFPQQRVQQQDADEYNRRMALNFERVRDFLLLHYVATKRDDSDMWRYFRNLTLPDSLQTKIELWLSRGYIQRYEFGVFLPPSWIAVLLGQNLMPTGFDPRVNNTSDAEFIHTSERMRKAILNSVNNTPLHREFLTGYGAASNSKPLMSAMASTTSRGN